MIDEEIFDEVLEDKEPDYTCEDHPQFIAHKPGNCGICGKSLGFIVYYTPVYEANKKAYEERKYRAIANEGSSRSSKTFSEMQLAATIGLQPKVYGVKQMTVVAPSLPHLKKGARKDFLTIAETWGFFREDNFNRTDNIYTFKGGSYIEFFGAEDSKKVHGPGRNILFVNEANLISFKTYQQLAIRTTQTIFLDYNPADEFSWVYKVADHPRNKIIHSTYKNNLNNLTKWQIDEIEALQEIDENTWKVYGLGLRGTSTETIYTHWKECDHFPECDQVVYGLDFGFNHPNVLIKVGVRDDIIYAEEMIYESKLTTDDLSYAIKTLGLNDTCEIYADSARPDTIEELNRAGLWVQAANKSVWDGINFVKGRKLYITRNSINLLKEIKSYKWMVDKNGIVTENPVKFKDDAMDALRYAAFTKFSQPLIQYAGATY